MKKMFSLLIGAFLLGAAFFIVSCFDKNKIAARPTQPNKEMTKTAATMSFYDLKANSLEGQSMDLSQYKGKKVIVLNVASKCGFTPQYADWQAFYDKNKENTVVLGFPSNQFMGQEPGSAGEIATFCSKNYGVTFPMFEKVDVKGADKSNVYQFLSDPAKNGWNDQEPSWNFCKYLVNEKGELTHFFASAVKPTDAEFMKAFGN
jgi:glutathione peroxidase